MEVNGVHQLFVTEVNYSLKTSLIHHKLFQFLVIMNIYPATLMLNDTSIIL